MPDIQLNFLAIGAAIAVNFVFAFIWYTPLFGKAWAREMGLPENYEPKGPQLAKGLILNALGCVFIAFVLANNIAAWTPATWGSSVASMSPVAQAFNAAFFSFLGFVLPVLFNAVGWENKSWKLFGINAGYYFFALFFASLILVYWR